MRPSDLRRTCERLCRKCRRGTGPDQLLLGHVSVQTRRKKILAARTVFKTRPTTGSEPNPTAKESETAPTLHAESHECNSPPKLPQKSRRRGAGTIGGRPAEPAVVEQQA